MGGTLMDEETLKKIQASLDNPDADIGLFSEYVNNPDDLTITTTEKDLDHMITSIHNDHKPR